MCGNDKYDLKNKRKACDTSTIVIGNNIYKYRKNKNDYAMANDR